MERRNETAMALRTANPADRIALRGVRLRSRLCGMSQRTVIEQTFVNLEPRAIEAVYTFPLPEGAAVCGFEVVTGDRVLTGVIEETGAAIERYEDAISEGHGAFMVEQERPDVFTARVGNLKPRQAATIQLTFVAPLEIADRAIRVAFPTTVAPRYATESGATDVLEARMDADALNPPHVLRVPYGLSMEVEVALGREVRQISSPTHAVRVEDREEGKVVTFAGPVADMDRDVILRIETAKEQQPIAEAAKGPDGADYLAVTFVPEFDPAELGQAGPSETIFVLDCSGSMMGESIAQATAALELCLRSLNEGDWFNICRFGSTFEMLCGEPLRYDESTLRQALRWISDVRGLGGTELMAPLQAILAHPPAVGSARTVIVLTDGQVTNEPAVIDLARKHRAHNRIFSFGIGSACSAFLVKGLARATSGAAEFISGRERIEEKVLRTFSRAGSPLVGDVQIDWGGADVATLAELPPVFDGDVLTVFGRAAGRLPRSVRLTCATPMGPRDWTLVVPTHGPEDGGVIATMWARRTIQSLEEVNGVRRTSVGDRRESRARSELIRLSKEFKLLCSLTTFIAVEHRSIEERNEGRPELRRVPVLLAQGWGSIDAVPGTGMSAMMAGGAIAAAAPCMAPPAPAPAQAVEGMARRLAKGLFGSKKRLRAEPAAAAASTVRPPRLPKPSSSMLLGDLLEKSLDKTLDRGWDVTKEAKPKRPTASPPAEPVFEPRELGGPPLGKDDLMALLRQQSASGAFDVNRTDLRALFAAANAPFDRWSAEWVLREIVPISPDDRERLENLVLVLILLRLEFAAHEELWRRAAQKAARFVGLSTGLTPEQVLQRIATATEGV
jgi:Ca-activated chloride channel family protein